ncbi:MAG: hypothetical protein KAG37_09700, partial [Flavobacteriales bacterium]|nr:hypothetical protein [Flavobacteriales bacterium]
WVEKFLVSYPKAMGWNFFRVHIGLLPDFWYELADKHGFVIQNEYPMWNLRGRNSGYQKEYTDWIWADGNHPSIVIWDALNEQRHDYIGNTLIPELRKLDPSRVWDAGWMSAEELSTMEMIEVHWYALGHGWWDKDEKVYRLREAFVFGEISKPYREMTALYKHDTPIILNEFVWLWQNRDGLTSSIRTYGSFTEDNKTPKNKDYEYYEPDGTQVYGNRDIYEYYLGKGATADQRWDFQAYMTNINIEIIRATREVAGIASFTYIANNGGHVGDWFKAPIADLIPTQALLAQHHSMREFGAYIDFEDGRYNLKPKSYATESTITFNVLAVNDAQEDKKGKLTIKLVDANNKETIVKEFDIELIKFWQKYIPMSITLPSTPGGYAIISELNEEGSDEIVQKSIRFINVGD